MNDFQLALISDKNTWTHPLCFPPPEATVVGVADTTIIRIFALLKSTIDEVEHLRLLVEKQDSPQARNKVVSKINIKKAHAQAIQAILSIEIANRFPHLWESGMKGYYGLCDGWKIIQIPIITKDRPAMIILGGQKPSK